MSGQYKVAWLCEALLVSRSGYYHWKERRHQPGPRQVESCFYVLASGRSSRSRRTYGSPRLARVLGCLRRRNRIARLMRAERLFARQRSKYRHATTDSRHGGPIALKRLPGFRVHRPNQVWVTDATGVLTGQGWLYLVAVLDLCSRRLVGWAMSPLLGGPLLALALLVAIAFPAPASAKDEACAGISEKCTPDVTYDKTINNTIYSCYDCKQALCKDGGNGGLSGTKTTSVCSEKATTFQRIPIDDQFRGSDHLAPKPRPNSVPGSDQRPSSTQDTKATAESPVRDHRKGRARGRVSSFDEADALFGLRTKVPKVVKKDTKPVNHEDATPYVENFTGVEPAQPSRDTPKTTQAEMEVKLNDTINAAPAKKQASQMETNKEQKEQKSKQDEKLRAFERAFESPAATPSPAAPPDKEQKKPKSNRTFSTNRTFTDDELNEEIAQVLPAADRLRHQAPAKKQASQMQTDKEQKKPKSKYRDFSSADSTEDADETSARAAPPPGRTVRPRESVPKTVEKHTPPVHYEDTRSIGYQTRARRRASVRRGPANFSWSFGEARRHYHRGVQRDRSWYASRFNRFALFAGGYYYWDRGYWYPAYGYDSKYSNYRFDEPIYGYDGLDPTQVIANMQKELRAQGYYEGSIDGLIGPQTRDALGLYQRDIGIDVTRSIDGPTVAALSLN